MRVTAGAGRLLTVRNAILFVVVGTGVAAAAVTVAGFLIIVGTVKLFMWAGLEGAAAFWGVVVLAIVALAYVLPSPGTSQESAPAAREARVRSGYERVSARLRTLGRPGVRVPVDSRRADIENAHQRQATEDRSPR